MEGRPSIDAHTLEIYGQAGFGRKILPGIRPAILVVDLSYGFTESQYPTGADLSPEVEATAELLARARSLRLPIIFTTIAYDEGQLGSLAWLSKAPGMSALRRGDRVTKIDARLDPQPEESVLIKTGASAFFGTPLISSLVGLRVDTLIVAGATTSGCVRASVVDAVQYGYPTLVPRECVGDRASGPHEASLFDMHQKYADVVALADVLSYLESLDSTEPSEVSA
jgi:maleamate amidohydrolase